MPPADRDPPPSDRDPPPTDRDLPPAAVLTSPIAGRGLFATAPIAAGRVVLRLGADDIRDRLNHSCQPNLGWADDATLFAIDEIAAGAELTVDYATRITDPAFTMMCHCETYRCRQIIEGTDWQIPQLQTRYAGRFAPAVQRLIAVHS